MSSTDVRPPRSVAVAFGLIAMSVLLAQVVLYASGRLKHAGYLLSTVVAAPMAARVGATLLFVAPLGFLMGMPMALGMGLVARSERLVLWGWSLNGVFSVLARVGAIYCAIYLGTARTFTIAAATYALAGAMLQIVRRRPPTAGAA